jgi:transposase
MRKIGEMLRLKAAGMNNRDIARSTGAGKTTVYEHLARAEAAGVSWPLPPELDDAALEALLYPPPSAELAASRPVPDWREVNRELKRKRHVTLRLLWLEWREGHPDGWGYSQFCSQYQHWLGEKDVVFRMEYVAGERMFVDFTGDTMPIIDAGTGEITQAQIFVSVLGASGMLYAEATRGQDLKSWLLAHVRAFEAYAGVATLTVPDNLKSGVTKACWYDPDVNPSYLEMARRYNTAILPTRTARPRDKAAVEVGVQVVERWVLAPLRNRRFFSLGELNEAIKEKLAEVNDRQFRGVPTSRRELFLEIERGALRPLPPTRYEFTEIKKASANIDYHVQFDDRFYSLPYQLVRQKVEVWATSSTVEIYHRHRRVASHLRGYGRRRYITDPNHLPASHRAHLEWSPSRLIQWAGSVGPEVAQVAEQILLSKPHPEHGYRACLGLMSLSRRHGRERMVAACARALAMNTVSYTSVKSILRENLDRLPLPDAELAVLPPPPAHANLRGAGYYRTEEAS